MRISILQIRDLVKNPPEGVRYTENDENTVSEIHAVIDGPGKMLTDTFKSVLTNYLYVTVILFQHLLINISIVYDFIA